MPALVWLGRRWRTGADDFTFSSALYFAIFVVCGALGLSRITTARPGQNGGPNGGQNGGENGGKNGGESGASFNYLKSCSGASYALGAAFFGLSVVDLVGAALFCATGFLSLRGAIFEVSRRSLVPLFLSLDAALLLCALALAAVCAKYALYDGERRPPRCGPLTGRVLEGCLALNFAVCGLFALSFALVFDPSGRNVYAHAADYERTWGRRCRLLCCRCRRGGRSGADSGGDDAAFRDVAAVFAQAFRAHDVVPSDVAAGLLLLHGYQYHSRQLRRERVRFAPPAADQRREKISSQAVPARRLSETQRALVRELQQYARFYMAAYGYLLYEFRNCCTGLPRLCCFDPCMCCRHHGGRHYGTRCYCNVTALLKESAIPEEDLLLTSWSNHVCKPVHFACYDRSTNAVVIAIRGTQSFIDIITDFSATPEVVALDGADARRGDKPFEAGDYYIHGGMLAAARYVWRSLEYNGVLEMITRGTYKDASIKVLGHSLGAGVALVLSVLMHSDLPEMRDRLRCLAYAPPGGTLSEAVVEYCKDFTVAGFMGYDMIPRLAIHTFAAFRESLFDVIAASSVPKSLVYLNVMRTPQVTRTIHPSASAATAGQSPPAPSPRWAAAASSRSSATSSTTPAIPRESGGTAVAAAAVAVDIDGDRAELVGASEESARYRRALREGSCVPLGQPKKLYPCKTLIHFRKAVKRSSCACGGECCCVCNCCENAPSACVEEVYYPCVEGPKEVQMLIAAPTMFTDHMPDRFYDVMKETVRQMDRQELERFYLDEDPEEIPETAAPMHYVSPTAAAAAAADVAAGASGVLLSEKSRPLSQHANSVHEPANSYGTTRSP